jgi:hypothetical protein
MYGSSIDARPEHAAKNAHVSRPRTHASWFGGAMPAASRARIAVIVSMSSWRMRGSSPSSRTTTPRERKSSMRLGDFVGQPVFELVERFVFGSLIGMQSRSFRFAGLVFLPAGAVAVLALDLLDGRERDDVEALALRDLAWLRRAAALLAALADGVLALLFRCRTQRLVLRTLEHVIDAAGDLVVEAECRAVDVDRDLRIDREPVPVWRSGGGVGGRRLVLDDKDLARRALADDRVDLPANLDVTEEVAELDLDGEHFPVLYAPARFVRGDEHAQSNAIDVVDLLECVDDLQGGLQAVCADLPGAVPRLERRVRVRAERHRWRARRTDAERVAIEVRAVALAKDAKPRRRIELVAHDYRRFHLGCTRRSRSHWRRCLRVGMPSSGSRETRNAMSAAMQMARPRSSVVVTSPRPRVARRGRQVHQNVVGLHADTFWPSFSAHAL